MKLNHFYCVIFTNFFLHQTTLFLPSTLNHHSCWQPSFVDLTSLLKVIFIFIVMSCNIKHIKYSPPLKDSHHSIFDAHKKDKSLSHSICVCIIAIKAKKLSLTVTLWWKGTSAEEAEKQQKKIIYDSQHCHTRTMPKITFEGKGKPLDVVPKVSISENI